MITEIEKTDNELKKVNTQRKKWIIASFIVLISIILVIILWKWSDKLNFINIWWLVLPSMIVILINWWYWTMKVIRRLLHHQKIEFTLLYDIMKEINIIKENLKKIKN